MQLTLPMSAGNGTTKSVRFDLDGAPCNECPVYVGVSCDIRADHHRTRHRHDRRRGRPELRRANHLCGRAARLRGFTQWAGENQYRSGFDSIPSYRETSRPAATPKKGSGAVGHDIRAVCSHAELVQCIDRRPAETERHSARWKVNRLPPAIWRLLSPTIPDRPLRYRACTCRQPMQRSKRLNPLETIKAPYMRIRECRA